MFYSILDSIDTDMCKWFRQNRGQAILHLIFNNYMLFFIYSVTKLEIIKYILTVSLILLIGLLSSYVKALDKDYYAKQAEEDVVSDDTAVSEDYNGSDESDVCKQGDTSAVVADTADESDVETVHDTVSNGAVTLAPSLTESVTAETSTTS